MDFTTVRENAEKGYGRELTINQRGMRIGAIQRLVRDAASDIGLSVDERVARLALASEVFEKEILTFSQLSDDELIALWTWALAGYLSTWLAERYGGSERLPGT